MTTIERGRNALKPLGTSTQPTAELSRAASAKPVEAKKPQRVADGFESKPTQAVAAVFTAAAGAPDRVYDGKLVGAGGQTFDASTPLSQVPPFTPRNNPNATETAIYINGISTTKDAQAGSLQALADSTGMRTIGIHNATEGMVSDVLQCVKDKLDKGKNPAVDTLADTVYSELKAGRDVHVMAHSQGGLITSRALNDVARRMRIEDGMSQADVEKALSHVKVETFGSAGATYPDGPQYVHYVNNRDLVPSVLGLGGSLDPLALLRHPGKGAQVERFSEKTMFTGAHALEATYLKHRVPFDQARAGQF
ncbi:hypothetical protein DRW03_31090 [Corallococcus sp. H22C18031201]|uniref:hypothetical protein n=1 Tax=Citreicoccus inhibens TaxID=2849499 RepID=UPI000E724BA8|nr:hypothetical protein [Citreicoccus inhibens]MBU8900218.1 hypothetical protein [Citreicoccus inhibens]RJS16385.1 hypothetical protein DRW03_31090 [Corallococcus sp. H22C18031201]